MRRTVPRYHQIAEALRARISAGGLTAGQRLDNQRQLAQSFGVTLMTLRQALDVLAREGLITRRHGLGTFVAPPPVDYDILQFRTLAGDLSAVGEDVATRFLRSRFGRADRRVAVALQGQRGLAAVGHTIEAAHGGPDVKRGRRGPAARAMAFHSTHDLGVKAEPAAEGEVPVPGEAEADTPLTSCPYRLDDDAGGIDRILRNPERPDEHIGQTARQRNQGRKIPGGAGAGCGRAGCAPAGSARVGATVECGARSARAQQAVHHLVDRSVATEGEHHLAALCHRLVGEFGGMAAVARVLDVKLDRRCQGRQDDIPAGAGRGCRVGIDDQQRSHAPRVMVCGPRTARGPFAARGA